MRPVQRLKETLSLMNLLLSSFTRINVLNLKELAAFNSVEYRIALVKWFPSLFIRSSLQKKNETH